VLRFAVGRNVILHVESQQRVRDSARANSQVLSDYKWDSKTNYTGRVLAAQEKLVCDLNLWDIGFKLKNNSS
jgi:hypothetical protein